MPDHVHVLASAHTADANGALFISVARQRSGFTFARHFNERLWQRYGYEHIVRDEESWPAVARYILENPVRGRLVVNPEDHPYSGSDTHEMRELLDGVGSWRPER